MCCPVFIVLSEATHSTVLENQPQVNMQLVNEMYVVCGDDVNPLRPGEAILSHH